MYERPVTHPPELHSLWCTRWFYHAEGNQETRGLSSSPRGLFKKIYALCDPLVKPTLEFGLDLCTSANLQREKYAARIYSLINFQPVFPATIRLSVLFFRLQFSDAETDAGQKTSKRT